MDINSIITKVTNEINNKTAPNTIAPAVVGNSIIELAEITKEAVEANATAIEQSKLKEWSANDYVSGSIVFYQGSVYESNANALATDIPGSSSKWIQRVRPTDEKYLGNVLTTAIGADKLRYIFPSGFLTSLTYSSSDNLPSGVSNVSQVSTSEGLKIVDSVGNSQDSKVSYFDTELVYNESLMGASVTAKLNKLNTSSPCIGLGVGSLTSPKAYTYRSTGALVYVEKFTTLILASNLPTYSANDVISIDIEKTATGLRIRTNKNGVSSSWVSHSNNLNGSILVAERGSADFVFEVNTTIFNQSKIYTDQQVETVKTEIDSKTTFSNASEGFAGVNIVETATGDVSGGTTRIIGKQIQGIGTIRFKKLEFYVKTAGQSQARLIILSRNEDGTFNAIREIAITLSVGLNTILAENVGAFTIPNGAYYGIHYVGGNFLAGVDKTPVATSFAIQGVASGNNLIAVSSNWLIQAKLSYSITDDRTVKQVVSEIEKALQPTEKITTTIFCSPNGNDSLGNGSIEKPFKTINRCITMHDGNYTKIVIAGGDYRERLRFSDIHTGTIEMVKNAKDVVRVLGSDQLTEWVKTPGYSNLWEIPFSKVIPAWDFDRVDHPIFEDKNPSAIIADEDRHPLQKGLSHRLPFTPIVPIQPNSDLESTLASLDQISAKYHYDGTKLYLHASNSSNPNINGFGYEVIQRGWNLYPSLTDTRIRPNLIMHSIQFLYGTTGFISSGFDLVTRYDCSGFAVASTGIWRDDTSDVYAVRDEGGYTGGDCTNGHRNSYSDHASQDMREGKTNCTYIDPWMHDAFDDGMSHHERHNVTVIGGLFEFNTDRGIVPANGCQLRGYNLHSRYNGQGRFNGVQYNDGAGFAVTNPATDGRKGTTAYFVNCLSENDNIGFSASDTNNILIALNPISINSVKYNYEATRSGKLELINPKLKNNEATKYKSETSGGLISNEGLNSLD